MLRKLPIPSPFIERYLLRPRPMAIPGPNPLSALTQLSPSVYFYHSSSTTYCPLDAPSTDQHAGASGAVTLAAPQTQSIQLDAISSSDVPKLIVLVTWMSAQTSHISKYIRGYQDLYPACDILLIRSSPPDLLYRRTRTQRHRVAPAISQILSACKSTNKDQAIILHVFSNGGSHQILNLLRANSELNSSFPFPSHVTILDSCPGRGTFKGSVLALSSALPKSQPLRLLLLLLIYLVVGMYWATTIPFGIPDPIERIRQALNDKELMKSELCRCYIYSESDSMVDWHDIEDHAADAAEKGFIMQSEKFEGSGHCAHARVAGGTRYWAIVDHLWQARQR